MLISVNCIICDDKHFDHFECSECGYNFGFTNPKCNYCCNCGTRLNKRIIKMNKNKNESFFKVLSHKISRINMEKVKK
jgi:hypothetical protein